MCVSQYSSTLRLPSLPLFAQVLPFGPGEDCLIVANDWHSSLVPVLVKDVYQPRGEFKNTKVGLLLARRKGQKQADRGSDAAGTRCSWEP